MARLWSRMTNLADNSATANDGDRPVKYNQRMGVNGSFFQYAQNLPVDSYTFPEEQIYATGTDALVYLTIYPRPTPWAITDADIATLTQQMAKLNSGGRRVLMRFAPEMNGNWNYWGQQPTQFLALWKRVYNALRRDAPETALVWAPSSGNGYPYGNYNRTSTADLALLDTNKDGKVDANDDPYSPYYPGDDMVDWIGVSIYHYGPSYPWQDNAVAEAGKFEGILNANNFYQTYAVSKGKPVMIAETGAAFHVNTPSGDGAGELAVKQSWWTQYITNATFIAAYPKVKLMCLFEFRKVEESIEI
jgi:beta-mannanase